MQASDDPLPSGTVSFLFSDIEGSTSLWERNPTAMTSALRSHDEIIRAAVESAGGRVFKTTGDGFHAVFPTARDGLIAAASMQRSLQVLDWPEETPIKVRMGLHAGPCEERDGDYFGPVMNRTARLMDVAHGGQTVASRTVFELAHETLPEGLSFLDLGEHRLKDLARPEHVFQLVVEGLEVKFPPLRSMSDPTRQHNLPTQLTSFVGRETEISDVIALLSSQRLVTLTGTGGAGKSRLALQVAAEVSDRYEDGVWLVELAPLTADDLIVPSLASAVGVREQPARPLVETLISVLADWHAVLILDNCEHVIDGCSKVVENLLRECPGLSVLATSREPLAVPGEYVYRVQSLSCPSDTPASPEEALSHSAVRLFAERAVTHAHGFVLNDASVVAATSICAQLDGLPLAIELAAARLSSLSPAQISTRLDDRFSLLSSGVRTSLPRQRTLGATIDWSYEMLADTEKSVLARLSVFSGGWSLEAAEKVCAFGTLGPAEVLHVLRSLVDKSLVQATLDGELMRYRLLETIRQYAAVKLAEEFESFEATAREAHARFFLDLAVEAGPHLAGLQQAPWLHRIELEHDNIRAALAFLDTRGDHEAALRLGTALAEFWYGGYLAEGAETLDMALDRLHGGASRTYAIGAVTAAYIHFEQGDYELAKSRFQQAADAADAAGDVASRSAALGGLGLVVLRQGAIEKSLPLCDEAARLASESGDSYVKGEALNHRAAVRAAMGDLSGSQADAERALEEFWAVENLFGIVRTLQHLAVLELKRFDLVAARRYVQQCLELRRTTQVSADFHGTLFSLGLIELLEGDPEAAKRAFSELLRISRRRGTNPFVAFALLGLAFCAGMTGENSLAALLHGSADHLFERLGESLDSDLDAYRQREQVRLRDQMGAAAFRQSYEDGHRMRMPDAVAVALDEAALTGFEPMKA